MFLFYLFHQISYSFNYKFCSTSISKFILFNEVINSFSKFFRNSLIREIEESPEEFEESYKSARTTVEEFHGHFKTQLEVESKLNKKGLENVKQYLKMCLFSYLCIALNRIQHGITEGLIDLGGLV
ncbi:MAG: hypothetical protein Q8R04_04020 [Nanoarchaeota archaeon]|nr:hypothetical protein [Nanoarchaeota archaeon]